MIKRIFLVACSLMVCVMGMVLPAFATEVQPSIKILQQPADYIATDSHYEFSVVAEGEGLTYLWFQSPDQGVTWTATGIRDAVLSKDNASMYDGYMFRCWIRSSDGGEVYTNSATLYYKKIPVHSAVDDSLTLVLAWINSITTSLFTPGGSLYPLLPVLAIGISVVFVLVCTKIFKSFSWGL